MMKQVKDKFKIGDRALHKSYLDSPISSTTWENNIVPKLQTVKALVYIRTSNTEKATLRLFSTVPATDREIMNKRCYVEEYIEEKQAKIIFDKAMELKTMISDG